MLNKSLYKLRHIHICQSWSSVSIVLYGRVVVINKVPAPQEVYKLWPENMDWNTEFGCVFYSDKNWLVNL